MTMITDPMATRRYRDEELAAFEERIGIRLPSSYKAYLVQVGAGEFTGSKVSLLEEWCQPYSEEELPSTFLSTPFAFREAWNDRTLIDPALGWRAPYYDKLLFRGAMRIVNVGCETYYLLVVSGAEAGNMWCDDRAGTQSGIFPLSVLGRRATFEDYIQNPDAF